jgi:hypothetical protein
MTLDGRTTVLIGVAVFAAAALIARLLHSGIYRTLDAVDVVNHESRAAMRLRAKRLVRALTLLTFLVAALAILSLTLELFGIDEPRWNLRELRHWFLTSGIRMILIVVSAIVLTRAASLVIEHLQHKLGRRHAQTDLEWQRRTSTLASILTSVITVAVGFVAVLMLLR